MKDLALVTGASRGIGFCLTRQFTERGYAVVAVGASERIHQLPERLPDAEIHPVRADLAADHGVDDVWAAVEGLRSPLRVAALNAGVSLGGAFVDTDLDDELLLLALNVTSQVRLAKRVVRAMVDQHRGHVLITTSLSALSPTPYESIYGPTRAFMYSFAQGLHQELKGQGVVVTALLPGATATEFHERAGMHNTAFGTDSGKNDPSLVARQGISALFAGKDHVVGGDARTRRSAIINKLLPERVKAARFAKLSNPARRTPPAKR